MVNLKKALKLKTSKSLLEKALLRPGIALIALSIISSLFYIYTNQRFLYNFVPDIFYYLNYAIILGGGFAAGYLLTIRKGKSEGSKAFNGITYAFIATSIYTVIDTLRVIALTTFDSSYANIDSVLFAYIPVISVALAVITGYFIQSRSKKSELTNKSKWALIIMFLGVQAFNFAQSIYYTFYPPADIEPSSWPLLFTIASYLAQPIVLALVAFFALSNIKGTLNRLFYATFVSVFAYVLNLTLWNFNTNPSVESVNVFHFVTFVVMLAVTAALTIQLRHSK